MIEIDNLDDDERRKDLQQENDILFSTEEKENKNDVRVDFDDDEDGGFTNRTKQTCINIGFFDASPPKSNRKATF